MSHIAKDDPVIESGEAARARHAPEVQHKRHLPAFWRHFLETGLAAMAVGMIVTGASFLSMAGLKTWDQAALQYPTQALLPMAAGMTIPMVAWMLFRGWDSGTRLRWRPPSCSPSFRSCPWSGST